MIISCSEIVIILNELLARKNNEISLLPFFDEEKIFNYNLKNRNLILKTKPQSWRNSIDTFCNKYSLTDSAKKEMPEFDEIKKATVSAGLLKPEGINELINLIKDYLEPKERLNRRKRFIIALDTNQLIDNVMSSYVEKEFSITENIQLRNFISYIISSWVLSERDAFLRNEKNKGIEELNNKLKRDFKFYIPEKIDKKARLGYSIFSELKALEESYTQLECKKQSQEKYEIMKNKNLKDQAIIEEYEDYKRSLKDVRLVYVTSDDQSYGLSCDRLESIKIRDHNKIPSEINCDFENGAKLIYQLTLFLGFLRINCYNIKFNIYYNRKEHYDWENKKLEFICVDKEFEESISKSISIVRRLNEF